MVVASIRLFGCYSLAYCLLVFLLMLIDYFNSCMCERSLRIAAQIKIMKKPSLVFTYLWYVIYLRLLPEIYMVMS
jgi:hypothetical protein